MKSNVTGTGAVAVADENKKSESQTKAYKTPMSIVRMGWDMSGCKDMYDPLAFRHVDHCDY